MAPSFETSTIIEDLRGLSSFRCIDLQCLDEDGEILVRATVGSGKDRSRLLAVLEKRLGKTAFTPLIQIDPLLDTPFSPTLPLETTSASEVPTDFFVEGGRCLAESGEEAFFEKN